MGSRQHKISQYLVAFLIAINLITTSLGQVEQCQGFGGYCLNHWDCCSNTCMHYLYKCTRPEPAIPETLWGNPYPRPSTLEEIIEMQFGKTTVGGNALEEPREFQSRFGDTLTEATSQLDVSAIAAAVEATTTAPLAAEIETTTTTTTDQQVAETSNASPNAASCSKIGVKCYRNSECCTQRCHGFLHQCVT